MKVEEIGPVVLVEKSFNDVAGRADTGGQWTDGRRTGVITIAHSAFGSGELKGRMSFATILNNNIMMQETNYFQL